ncbi:MAG: hypothetical protein IT582_05070 [Opitutaceae bacterium]|nr:hypothetical protein [Opitutaceae bacterium]
MSLLSTARAAEVLMHGTLLEGGKIYVALRLDDKTTTWLEEGESIDGYTVVKINHEAEYVNLLTRSGRALKVSLSYAKIQSDPGESDARALIPLDKLNWTWIKSDANPMRKEREMLPDWAARNWRVLSEDTKLALKNYYRSHGWDIVVTPKGSNGLHVKNIRLKDPSEPLISPEELRNKKDKRRIVSPIISPEP